MAVTSIVLEYPHFLIPMKQLWWIQGQKKLLRKQQIFITLHHTVQAYSYLASTLHIKHMQINNLSGQVLGSTHEFQELNLD